MASRTGPGRGSGPKSGSGSTYIIGAALLHAIMGSQTPTSGVMGVRVQRTILPIVSGNHLYELSSQAFGTDVRDITITRQNDAGETVAIVMRGGLCSESDPWRIRRKADAAAVICGGSHRHGNWYIPGATRDLPTHNSYQALHAT